MYDQDAALTIADRKRPWMLVRQEAVRIGYGTTYREGNRAQWPSALKRLAGIAVKLRA